jgi:GntR family transcriptional regulator / MocR family aminotransferase
MAPRPRCPAAEARAAVVAWALGTGALIVEDDDDVEYRYDRAPIGAIQGLVPDQVAYAGTASKTLAPGFRLGWFVLPPDLLAPFAAAKLLAELGRRLPQLRANGIAAGLHLVVGLPDDLPEAALVEAAHTRGLAIAGVAPHRLARVPPGGLIFGYSDLSTSALRPGVRLLEAAVDAVSGTAG